MKGTLKSKKFIAYLLSEFGWKLLILYVLWEYGKGIDHYAFMVLISMIVTSGFIQIGYILGQAALDKYTHVAVTALEREANDVTSSSNLKSKSNKPASQNNADAFDEDL